MNQAIMNALIDYNDARDAMTSLAWDAIDDETELDAATRERLAFEVNAAFVVLEAAIDAAVAKAVKDANAKLTATLKRPA